MRWNEAAGGFYYDDFFVPVLPAATATFSLSTLNAKIKPGGRRVQALPAPEKIHRRKKKGSPDCSGLRDKLTVERDG
jgi:hypothetical protein